MVLHARYSSLIPLLPQSVARDGKQMLKNQIVSLDETGQIGPTPFAIGNSSAGGNACDGSPFVIRFVANEPVRIDGPLESCFEV